MTRTVEVEGKTVEIVRSREHDGGVVYEALAPDGHCWMTDIGLLWGLIGDNRADCLERIKHSRLLKCDDDADLEDDEMEIYAANGVKVCNCAECS